MTRDEVSEDESPDARFLLRCLHAVGLFVGKDDVARRDLLRIEYLLELSLKLFHVRRPAAVLLVITRAEPSIRVNQMAGDLSIPFTHFFAWTSAPQC